MNLKILRCSCCGGEMDIDINKSIGICKYCGNTNLIASNFVKKGNLYNLATFYRQNGDFAKAADVYNDILKEDMEEPQAHWGLVLSKYGIEYIKDPNSMRMFPTCHQIQEQSVLTDPNYLAAVEYSDAEGKKVLKDQAEEIQTILDKIMSIVRNEKPYDIFICYKESDADGDRTKDSVIAQDIYGKLSKKYKVFFARITLESKLGTEYEPIIYAALNSAKVMLVLGTKKEYFNETWVKNEWSRFLQMSKSADKIIIPMYKGFSPYELPHELAMFQSLDMSKIGYMQDLIHGVDKFFESEPDHVIKEAPEIEHILKNADTYIKIEKFKSAESEYQKITEKYPDDYRGWWGLIRCATFDFTKYPGNEYDTVMQYLRYVRKLAPKKEADECVGKITQYFEIISDEVVDLDISSLKNYKNHLHGNIDRKTKDLQKIKSDIITKENTVFDTQKKEIQKTETEAARCDKWLKQRKRRIIIGLVSVAIGILLCIFEKTATGIISWFYKPYNNIMHLVIASFIIAAGIIVAVISNIHGTQKDLLDMKTETEKKYKSLTDKLKWSEKTLQNEISELSDKAKIYESELNTMKNIDKSIDSYINADRDLLKSYNIWSLCVYNNINDYKKPHEWIIDLKASIIQSMHNDKTYTIKRI